MTRSPATEKWWQGAAIYQIYPRSFLDSNGDGIGDLPGIVSKLDYIAALGVDAIWISPFFRSPMKDFGYDVSDMCAVDEMFGTLADFDALIAGAHRRGLRVIIDQVYSHTSDQHAWFEESRQSQDNAKADWYVWADPKQDGSPPNNWQSVFGGPAWEWDARRQQYYLHNFLSSQPDLNLHNPEAQAEILQVTRFWLDRGVDGFRLDAINFAMHDQKLRDNPPSHLPIAEVTRPFDMQAHVYNQSHPEIVDFLERVQAVVNSYDNAFTVAEVVGPDPYAEMKAFIEGEARLSSAYSFDFLYADEISPESVARALKVWEKEGDGWPSWAFSNHDAPRAVSRWAPEAQRAPAAKMLLMLLLSLRGNVFLYQGEELGLPQAHVPFEQLQDPEAIANWPRTLGRDGARTPMPWEDRAAFAGFSDGGSWLPVDNAQAKLAVSVQEGDPTSCLELARAAIKLRAEQTALRLGALEVLPAPEGVLALQRMYRGQSVLCLFNMTDAPIVHEAEGVFQGSVLLSSAPHDKVLPQTLPAYSAYWLRQA